MKPVELHPLVVDGWAAFGTERFYVRFDSSGKKNTFVVCLTGVFPLKVTVYESGIYDNFLDAYNAALLVLQDLEVDQIA